MNAGLIVLITGNSHAKLPSGYVVFTVFKKMVHLNDELQPILSCDVG